MCLPSSDDINELGSVGRHPDFVFFAEDIRKYGMPGRLYGLGFLLPGEAQRLHRAELPLLGGTG